MKCSARSDHILSITEKRIRFRNFAANAVIRTLDRFQTETFRALTAARYGGMGRRVKRNQFSILPFHRLTGPAPGSIGAARGDGIGRVYVADLRPLSEHCAWYTVVENLLLQNEVGRAHIPWSIRLHRRNQMPYKYVGDNFSSRCPPFSRGRKKRIWKSSSDLSLRQISNFQDSLHGVARENFEKEMDPGINGVRHQRTNWERTLGGTSPQSSHAYLGASVGRPRRYVMLKSHPSQRPGESIDRLKSLALMRAKIKIVKMVVPTFGSE